MQTTSIFTIENLCEELESIGLTDMTVICDWAEHLFDDHGNSIEIYKTPQETMFRLIWTDLDGIEKISGGTVYPTKAIMVYKPGQATEFVEYLREKHPS